MEVQSWNCQLGTWMGLKMEEPACKGLTIERAGRESGIKAREVPE